MLTVNDFKYPFIAKLSQYQTKIAGMLKENMQKCQKNLVDYFIHISPDFSKPIPENPQNLTNILPITEIEVLKNDKPSDGFELIGLKDNDSNFFSKTLPSNLNLAVKRSTRGLPIIDVELINEDDEIPADFKVVHFTPTGKSANFYGADGESYFLGYRLSKNKKMGLVDLNFLKVSKSNEIPHAYYYISTPIRQSLFEPEFMIIYKISIISFPLKFFDTFFKNRYPIEDISEYQIPANIAYFCLPEGGFIDSTVSKIPQKNFIQFSLTTFNGLRVYGTSMVYYTEIKDEKILSKFAKKAEDYYFCESLCFLSQSPVFKKLRRFSEELYKIFQNDWIVDFNQYLS